MLNKIYVTRVIVQCASKKLIAPRKSMNLTTSDKIKFPHMFVTPPTKRHTRASKTEQRRIVAEHALSWITYQHMCGAKGCILFDIDDTLIDGTEQAKDGFEFMVSMYHKVFRKFPVHIVTARPDDTRNRTMDMLESRGICIPPDRLHMLESHLWGEGDEFVEQFKWNCHVKCCKMHTSVIARFGDKLWDVAHIQSLHTYLGFVKDEDCVIFFDPFLKGTLSGKLPGKD